MGILNAKAMRMWVLVSIRQTGWVPILFFLLHILVSKGFEAYLHLPWLDIPMHFFGGVAITYFLWHSLRNPKAEDALGPRTLQADTLLAALGVGTTIAIWEFAEWSTDALGFTDAQVGLDDTMLDMFLGLTGGWLYLVFALLCRRPL